MSKRTRTSVSKVAILAMLAIGVFMVIVSAFFPSSLVSILWVALICWSAILVYVVPAKHVSVSAFYGAAEESVGNIERIIKSSDLSLKGIYLPPGNLGGADASLVVLPRKSNIALPSSDEITDSLMTGRKDGVLIVPPGVALCRFFERELNVSFGKLSLKQLQVKLPNLFVEKLELAKRVDISVKDDVVVVEVGGCAFDEDFVGLGSFSLTRELVGSLLGSAVACLLVKCVGAPVVVESEVRNVEARGVRISFRLLSSVPSSVVAGSSLKEEFASVLPKIVLPRVSGGSVSSVGVLDLLRPVFGFVVGLLALGLVVDVFVWLVGWRLYDVFGVWRFVANFDFKNLLLLGMELVFVLVLFGGRFLRRLAGNVVFGWFSLVCVVCGLAAAGWTGGWLLYGRFGLVLGVAVYSGLLVGVMALVVVVGLLVGRPRSCG